MSKLRYADYTDHLAGKTVKRVRWSNEPDFHNLSIEFTDQTHVSFRFELTIDEGVELADFKDGNLSNERRLSAIPVRAKIPPLNV
jgi:hypothetical protein